MVVTIEEKRVLAGSPTLLIRNTPDSDTNTLRNLKTTVHDGQIVVGSGPSNVELGDGNLLDVGGSKSSQGSGSARGRVPSTGSGQVRLTADTIDGNALREPLVDVLNHTLGQFSVIGIVNVVVIDVELSIWISGTCSAESNTDKVLSENPGENTISTEVAVLAEDLINNIPVDNLALVMGHNIGNVVLDDRSQGVTIVDILYPRGDLSMPEESVTANKLAILTSKVNNTVGIREGELVAVCCTTVNSGNQFGKANSLRSRASHFMLFSFVI